MADLIVGVVVNILRHVPIQDRERRSVRGISSIHARDLVVLGSTQLRVLNPQIGFDLLQSLQEGQDGDVALGDW